MTNLLVRGRKGADGVVDNNNVSPRGKTFTSFASDVDLTSIANNPQGKCCRAFVVNDVGSGTKLLAVTLADGSTDTWDMTNMQGVRCDVALRSITGTTTTIGKIIVFW